MGMVGNPQKEEVWEPMVEPVPQEQPETTPTPEVQPEKREEVPV